MATSTDDKYLTVHVFSGLICEVDDNIKALPFQAAVGCGPSVVDLASQSGNLSLVHAVSDCVLYKETTSSGTSSPIPVKSYMPNC
eukprot:116706-Pelagomonas_calceolata.AAC.3